MRIRDFFYLQKSDRVVFLFFLCLVALAASIFFFVGGLEKRTAVASADSLAFKRDSSRRSARYPYMSPRPYRTDDGRQAELFAFDPNTADSTQLLRLGLSPWQVRNIYRYRAKGGVYRTPEDFARVYGLTRKQYMDMRPYIQISDDYAPAANFVQPRPVFSPNSDHHEYSRDTVLFPMKLKAGQTIDLATADTTQLKKIPGIGTWWARRIVGYGARLGGYVSVAQLKEIEDFPVETLPYFRVGNAHPTKLNINALTINQLRRHPYINFYQAREICDYRRLKGHITDLSQLSLLKDFPPEEIERLRPYVTF